MIRINENYLKLQANYLFVTVGKKVKEYQENNPNAKIIKLGIGDVTRPIVPEVINAMHKAIDEMGNQDTFRGYGPEQGYDFLREKIQKYDYERHGVSIDADEIFVSDGAKCDCGNIGDIFDIGNKVAITDPVYPVYLDTNVMAGRSGDYDEESGKYKNIVYMPCTKDNNFVPELPNERVDMIYLCLPNNPTGTTLSREDLKRFVDYAIENKSVILFDAAYEIFIDDPNVPHSIYEIEGAKECAIEFKSYSKTAGFTGLRCGYVVIPKTVFGFTESGEKVALNGLWNRRTCTKFNGTSYIVQRGAEAIYTDVGQKQILLNVNYYKDNARIIRQGLLDAGFTVFGGENAPYIWLKTPDGINSWEFFDILLEKVNVVGTPGVGFGPCGEGYFRLTAFGSKENTIEAMERIKKAAKENVFTK